jgi:hypothetical protein
LEEFEVDNPLFLSQEDENFIELSQTFPSWNGEEQKSEEEVEWEELEEKEKEIVQMEKESELTEVMIPELKSLLANREGLLPPCEMMYALHGIVHVADQIQRGNKRGNKKCIHTRGETRN